MGFMPAMPKRSSHERKPLTWLLGAALLLSACAGPIKELYPPPPGSDVKRVYVVKQNWHTGIALRRSDIPFALWPQIRDFPDVEYLEVSWGDADYFPAPDPTLGMLLKAALVPTRSVLHVVGFDGPVEEHFPISTIVEITLSEAGFEQLCRFIAQTYAVNDKDADGVKEGLYLNSRFYPARPTFHIFRTCNTWVAQALRSAGYPITPFYAVTAGNVIRQVSKFGAVVKRRP
jgi:uncharacterized protein (TIGR02117 family)